MITCQHQPMLHIDTILSLYPDNATRLLLLSQALAHTQADLASLRHAVDAGDRNAALAHTHRAKGTASFLGADKQALQQFDQLTQVLRNTADDQPDSSMRTNAPGQSRISAPAKIDCALARVTPAAVNHALKAVESILQELKISIQTAINELENKKNCIRGE